MYRLQRLCVLLTLVALAGVLAGGAIANTTGIGRPLAAAGGPIWIPTIEGQYDAAGQVTGVVSHCEARSYYPAAIWLRCTLYADGLPVYTTGCLEGEWGCIHVYGQLCYVPPQLFPTGGTLLVSRAMRVWEMRITGVARFDDGSQATTPDYPTEYSALTWYEQPRWPPLGNAEP